MTLNPTLLGCAVFSMDGAESAATLEKFPKDGEGIDLGEATYYACSNYGDNSEWDEMNFEYLGGSVVVYEMMVGVCFTPEQLTEAGSRLERLISQLGITHPYKIKFNLILF